MRFIPVKDIISSLIVSLYKNLYICKLKAVNMLAIVNKQEVYLCFHIRYMMYVLRKKGKNVPVSNVKAIREIKF